jgi:hypothetical protein
VKIPRHAFLIASLILLCAMSLFAFTPTLWIHDGRAEESYPELVYLGLGLPAALIAAVASMLDLRFSSSRSSRSRAPARLVALVAMGSCVWLSLIGLAPTDGALASIAGPTLEILLNIGLPVLAIGLIAATFVVRRAPNQP